jgi:AmmeMemoRadiSam system protein B
MALTVRPPAVAGRFYPGDPEVLLREVQSFLSPRENISPALGCVVPHAGYLYSGHVAGAVFARLELPQRFIILCPNHTGRGTPLSIMSRGSWQTPLGPAAIDEGLAEKLARQFPLLSEDFEAHRAEHAVEVELPFLQALQPGFTFVPITLGTGQIHVLTDLGEAIAEVVRGEKVFIIASSDMNHYESEGITRAKDRQAIERILALDPAGLHDVVTKEKISMCGLGPTVAMLTATKRLGASAAELIKYAAAGDISGDRDKVVGYAGIVVR